MSSFLLEFPSLCYQVSVRREKQRADDFEGKYVKAQKSCEEQSRKFEETEMRVQQLENLLNR